MNITPIWRSLAKHKLTVALLVVEVIVTCALVCNVVFLIAGNVQRINIATGVNEHALVMLHSTSLSKTTNPIAQHREDLLTLRDISGVLAAAAVSRLPLGTNEWTSTINVGEDAQRRVQTSIYYGTPGLLKTLGLQLVAGRDFNPDEYVPAESDRNGAGIDHATSLIVTRQLAERLFPGQSALGKLVYPGKKAARIIGIVNHLLRPTLHGPGENELSAVLPMLPDGRRTEYVMRTLPASRQQVLSAAKKALTASDPHRLLGHGRTFDQMRHEFFGGARSAMSMLIASCIGLLFVTALGIVGLASFWVQRRRRQIGIRRALGASKRDILRYFQTENALIMTIGIVPGALLAVLMNVFLMQHFAVDRLPLWYLAVGATLFWILGQLAVLLPALRASRVPPVEATRSV